jgi:hypothetical protein
MVTEGCVILVVCPPCLEQMHWSISFLRRHISSVFRQSPLLLLSSIISLRIPREGGELMAMLSIAMMGKLPYSVLQNAVFAHPTLAESLNNLFGMLS